MSLVMLSYKTECCYFADKKRYSGDGSGSGPKFLEKYKNIGSGTKCKYILPVKRTMFQSFILGTERSCLPIAIGIWQEKAKWKSKILGLCPRFFLMKVFSRNGIFTECRGMC